MPILQRCCCCWDTRKGSVIVGIYSMVMASIGAALIILSLVFWNNLVHSMKNSFLKANVDPPDWFFKLVYIGNIVALVVVAFYVFVCLVMIHGVRKDKHMLLLPWISWTAIIVVFGIISLVIQIVYGAVHSETLYLLALVIVLLVFFFWVYCLLVVISQYQVLKGR